MDEEETRCQRCRQINKRKRLTKCIECSAWYHLTCVGLTRAQAEVIQRWTCPECRGVQVNQPVMVAPIGLQTKEYISSCRENIRVLAKIPRGAVITVADAYERLLRRVLEEKTQMAWTRLLSFCFWGLQRPDSQGTTNNKLSLATRVRRQVADFLESDTLPNVSLNQINLKSKLPTNENRLKKRISAKFADNDIRGAVREIVSTDVQALKSEATLKYLKDKHPAAPGDLELPEAPDDELIAAVTVTEEDVAKGISTFSPSSSAGPCGLRPGHLKSIIGRRAAEAGARLLSTLTSFVNMVLRGEVPEHIQSIFFGAALCALVKKDGGIRPIAIGNTLRRLATKVGAKSLSPALGSQLRPVQLGFSTRGGCEAATHATRKYLAGAPESHVLLKIDIRNAFNCLRRDVFLSAARERVPGMFRLLWQAYANPSILFYGDNFVNSETGIQQGDPFGPALFSLGVDAVARSVETALNIWYLDDATFGDEPQKVLSDLRKIKNELGKLGLVINGEKCELIVLSHDAQHIQLVERSFRSILPDIKVVQKDKAKLLGAPIASQAIPEALRCKLEDLQRLSTRLELIDSHQAFVLLKNSFTIPKLHFLLRSTPAYEHVECVREFDHTVKDAFQRITNVSFDNVAWDQATLPISSGGLGVRKAVDIALPSFISSMFSVSPLVESILSRIGGLVNPEEVTVAVEEWSNSNDGAPLPEEESRGRQRSWDQVSSEILKERLLNESDQVGRARLLAAASKGSGDWLHAMPVPSLGTQLDRESLRVAVAQRVGATVCEPHSCRCGRRMDSRGLHGLSCRFSAGRHPRHSALNDIIRRCLLSAGIPSLLEPVGIDRGDGKRPDGITVFPYRNGRSLVWDCTCVDTFADTWLNRSAVSAGSAAEGAENRKREKYRALSREYQFEPIAIETTGVIGESSMQTIHEMGERLREVTGDARETFWLRQRLSLAVQRGNAFSILTAGREMRNF